MQFEDLPLDVRRLIWEADPTVTLKAGKISKRYRNLTKQEREKIIRCTRHPVIYHYETFLNYTNDLQPIGLMYIKVLPEQYPELSSTPYQTGEVVETTYFPEGYTDMYFISYTLHLYKDGRLEIKRYVESTSNIRGGVRGAISNIQAAGPRSRLDVLSSWEIAVRACGEKYREVLGSYYIAYFDKIFSRYFDSEDLLDLTIAGAWVTLHFLATDQLSTMRTELLPIEEAREVILREYKQIRPILKEYLS